MQAIWVGYPSSAHGTRATSPAAADGHFDDDGDDAAVDWCSAFTAAAHLNLFFGGIKRSRCEPNLLLSENRSWNKCDANTEKPSEKAIVATKSM
eukprot:scaffold4957_cov152-Amphora_coffeaeformis.AAC.2